MKKTRKYLSLGIAIAMVITLSIVANAIRVRQGLATRMSDLRQLSLWVYLCKYENSEVSIKNLDQVKEYVKIDHSNKTLSRLRTAEKNGSIVLNLSADSDQPIATWYYGGKTIRITGSGSVSSTTKGGFVRGSEGVDPE